MRHRSCRLDEARSDATVLVLTLAIAPAVGLGIARFAYALVLPDMRADLGWSWTEAGWMNTTNALGYLAGALVAARAIARLGAFRTTVYGTAACVASLGSCAVLRDALLLNLVRVLAGLGGALAFVAGGTLAAGAAATDARRSAFLLGLYYAGPGVGIAVSGLVVPLVLHRAGPGSWALAWAALAVVSAPFVLVLARSAAAHAARPSSSAPPSGPSPVAEPMRTAPLLLGYALFGAGYIAYMTFMVAWVRDAGGGALEQALFWVAIGAAATGSPWVWARTLERRRHGHAFALLCAVTALGAALPLVIDGSAARFASAVLFGGAFFAVVASTTAFVRRNVPRADWGRVIGTLTAAFGLGQMLGPIAAGAINDRTHGLSSGLTASVLLLLASATIGAFQRDRFASGT